MAIDVNSFTAAKAKCFEQVAAANGSTLHENGFIGRLMPAADVWGMFFGGGGDVRNTWNHEITELRMDSDIVGQFTSQGGADIFIMGTLDALPIRLEGNVAWYRLRSGGMPKLTEEWRQVGGDNKQSLLWVVRIGLEVVFDTTFS